MYSPGSNKPMAGGGMCRPCAEGINTEYAEKLGEQREIKDTAISSRSDSARSRQERCTHKHNGSKKKMETKAPNA